jgi:hypothetical protein
MQEMIKDKIKRILVNNIAGSNIVTGRIRYLIYKMCGMKLETAKDIK